MYIDINLHPVSGLFPAKRRQARLEVGGETQY